MAIYFYSTRDNFGCFSNFSAHGFELNGKYWKTSEHYFQAMKFEGSAHEDEIRLAKSPKEAAVMGRERHRPLRPDWDAVKDEVMFRAVMAKFGTHEDIRNILLSTGSEDLIEKTSDDYHWGCGTEGWGKNMLGKILVQVREKLSVKQS